jgi:ribonuclease T1
MRRRVLPWQSAVVGLLAVLSGFSGWSAEPVSPQETDRRSSSGAALLEEGPQPAVSADEPPQKARDLLASIVARNGEPLPGYAGGREFRNRERRLPRGRYREYDVNPRLRGRPRDAERIVIEQRTGKAYYTPDHYQTFIAIN